MFISYSASGSSVKCHHVCCGMRVYCKYVFLKYVFSKSVILKLSMKLQDYLYRTYFLCMFEISKLCDSDYCKTQLEYKIWLLLRDPFCIYMVVSICHNLQVHLSKLGLHIMTFRQQSNNHNFQAGNILANITKYLTIQFRVKLNERKES